jgi:dihydrofolate reductase
VRKLIYSATVSLDGFIAGPGGDLQWSVPSEELLRFHNERVAQLGVHLCGRRLYEVMTYWDGPEPDAHPSAAMREFAAIWRALPKLVFSTTLERVGPNATLLRGGVADVVERLRREDGDDIEVGGAGLAGECARLGLIDEYRVFVSPIVLGGGTPHLASLEAPISLELLETRTFDARVVYLRYSSTSPR